MSGDLPTGPQGALIRAISFTLSLFMSSTPQPGCGMPPSPIGSLALAWCLLYSPLVWSRFCLD
jgi:hypothetical protein